MQADNINLDVYERVWSLKDHWPVQHWIQFRLQNADEKDWKMMFAFCFTFYSCDYQSGSNSPFMFHCRNTYVLRRVSLNYSFEGSIPPFQPNQTCVLASRTADWEWWEMTHKMTQVFLFHLNELAVLQYFHISLSSSRLPSCFLLFTPSLCNESLWGTVAF